MSSQIDTAKRLMNEYYDALRERTDWGHLISDEFVLSGTVAKPSIGREAVVGNSFYKMIRSLRVKELISQGDSGFALVSYDLTSPKGHHFTSEVAEFWKANRKELTSLSIYFDTAAFSAAMGQ